MYQFRINEQEKADTFKVFEEMGMKPAQAIRLFFRHIRNNKKIPFEIEHIPNAATAKLLLLNDMEKDYKRFDSLEDLFHDLRN